MARLPYATQDGNRITLHNIRDFEYRSETDFIPRYYETTFDLDKLDSVDLLASYWMGPAIAHTFVSFGFGERDYVAMSAEMRAGGEGYSPIKGFFKQYELIYVVGDERDLISCSTPASIPGIRAIRGSCLLSGYFPEYACARPLMGGLLR